MNPSTPTMPERLENLECLLFAYAQAVYQMRQLQRVYEQEETLTAFFDVERAEKQVDAMTTNVFELSRS